MGSGQLSFSALRPTLSRTVVLGGRGQLAFPSDPGIGASSVPIRVMALASGITADSQRFAYQAELDPAGPTLMARTGLFPTGANPADLIKVTALQAKVTPFQAFIGGDGDDQPGYRVTVDEDVVLTFAPGSGGDPRIDLVVVRVRDNPHDASGVQTGSVEIIPGTPAATPAAPAVPVTTLALWQVLVPGSTTGAVGLDFAVARTNRRVYTAASGGALRVPSQAIRDSIPVPFEGMTVWREDRRWHETYDGTAWRVRGAVAVPDASSLGYVTHPFDGQAAVTTVQNDLLQWDGATSSWVSFVYGAMPYGYGAWMTYIPALTQTSTPSQTINQASYTQVGRIVVASVQVTVTGVGAQINALIRANLPVTSATAAGQGAIGRGYLYDASTATWHTFIVIMETTTTVAFIRSSGAVNPTPWLGSPGSGFTAALAPGDVFSFTVAYEAAT
jgi:hypothetical protein